MDVIMQLKMNTTSTSEDDEDGDDGDDDDDNDNDDSMVMLHVAQYLISSTAVFLLFAASGRPDRC